MLLGITINYNCPVCNNYNYRDFSHTLSLSSNSPRSPRAKIVGEIFLIIMREGSFQVSSVKEFWMQFSEDLCSSCQQKLNLMGTHRMRALKLLQEAVKLDPDNKIAMENLKKVKQMS